MSAADGAASFFPTDGSTLGHNQFSSNPWFYASVTPTPNAPEAQLVLTSRCALCPTVLEALCRLVKEGEIGALNVINAETNPRHAELLGVRSVPWVRIGEFVLAGARGYEELKGWARAANSGAGRGAYLRELLKTGSIKPALELVRATPGYLDALIPLIADVDAELQVRLGASAIVEHLQGSPELAARVDALAALTRSDDARVRADACHALALSGSAQALPHVRRLLDDASDEVQEIARESLAALGASGHGPASSR
jgi:hypothetical protein